MSEILPDKAAQFSNPISKAVKSKVFKSCSTGFLTGKSKRF